MVRMRGENFGEMVLLKLREEILWGRETLILRNVGERVSNARIGFGLWILLVIFIGKF